MVGFVLSCMQVLVVISKHILEPLANSPGQHTSPQVSGYPHAVLLGELLLVPGSVGEGFLVLVFS